MSDVEERPTAQSDVEERRRAKRERKEAKRARKEAKVEVTRWRRQKYSRRVMTRLSAMADGY